LPTLSESEKEEVFIEEIETEIKIKKKRSRIPKAVKKAQEKVQALADNLDSAEME